MLNDLGEVPAVIHQWDRTMMQAYIDVHSFPVFHDQLMPAFEPTNGDCRSANHLPPLFPHRRRSREQQLRDLQAQSSAPRAEPPKKPWERLGPPDEEPGQNPAAAARQMRPNSDV